MEIKLDLSSCYVIMDEAVNDMSELSPFISIKPNVKNYPSLLHTTNIESLQHILCDRTFRCTSLCNPSLNDPQECQRPDVSQFAGSVFAACFSHTQSEVNYFWENYGGNIKSQKVLLRFRNFARDLKSLIYTDYCFSDKFKVVAFAGNEDIIPPIAKNNDTTFDRTCYDTSNSVRTIKMFDINYVPADSDVFTRRNIERIVLTSNNANNPTKIQMTSYDVVHSLGKDKDEKWGNDTETRLECTLLRSKFKEWECIYLRLKDEFFRGLTIVLSPYCTPAEKINVLEIIKKSPISDSIKESISIVHSELQGKL